MKKSESLTIDWKRKGNNMYEILDNLALIDLNSFCKENSIDYSGTYLLKVPRKWTWKLVRAKDSKHAYLYGSYTELATVTFHKNSVPTHQIF